MGKENRNKTKELQTTGNKLKENTKPGDKIRYFFTIKIDYD